MKIRKNIFAFTLIEMMVVVAVTMLLAGVGAVSLNNFNSNQKLEAAKEALIIDMKLARNIAVTNQVPSGAGFVFVDISDGDGYSMISARSGDGSENYFSNKNEGVTGINSSFGFAVETGQLTDSDGVLWSGDDLTFTLVDEFDNEKCIKVESSGLIYEEDSCD